MGGLSGNENGRSRLETIRTTSLSTGKNGQKGFMDKRKKWNGRRRQGLIEKKKNRIVSGADRRKLGLENI